MRHSLTALTICMTPPGDEPPYAGSLPATPAPASSQVLTSSPNTTNPQAHGY